MENIHENDSLFHLTKNSVGFNLPLQAEFVSALGDDTSNSSVADFWDEKLYQLEEEAGSSHLLHHRVYLQESKNDPDFYHRYFESQIVGILT